MTLEFDCCCINLNIFFFPTYYFNMYSFQRTSPLCCFITMAGQVIGKSLSGQSELSMSVPASKLNGNCIRKLIPSVNYLYVKAVIFTMSLFVKCNQGGTLNGFFILTLWHHTTIFSSGMRILGWRISMERSK